MVSPQPNSGFRRYSLLCHEGQGEANTEKSRSSSENGAPVWEWCAFWRRNSKGFSCRTADEISATYSFTSIKLRFLAPDLGSLGLSRGSLGALPRQNGAPVWEWCRFLEEQRNGFWWVTSHEILCQILHFPWPIVLPQ